MSGTGVSTRFKVEINGTDGDYDLGDWNKVEGMSVERDIHEQREGGNNEFVHRLPGRIKYTNLKLTRPITKATADVAAWVSKAIVVERATTATITVLDSEGEEVTAWTLQAVYPARWTGPNLETGSNAVATETLELAHHGFLEAR
jgi:phage tail-like protein